jgi:protein gp37
MGEHTGISWTDATWNPIRGCTRKSEGCRFCYAERVAARFSDQGAPYHGFAERGRPGSKWTGRVELVEKALDLPIRWRKPRRIFVNSMSDLFHESLPDEAIDRVFAVMALAPQHTFQVLTKRADRMRRYFLGISEMPNEPAARDAMIEGAAQALFAQMSGGVDSSLWLAVHMPLPNVWLGVSVENQAAWDERWPALAETPAAVRFVSFEPLIGPIDTGLTGGGDAPDWWIIGGESGPGARPMRREWAQALIRQCDAVGAAPWFKQVGDSRPDEAGWPRGITGKGDDPAQWPSGLHVQRFPEITHE